MTNQNPELAEVENPAGRVASLLARTQELEAALVEAQREVERLSKGNIQLATLLTRKTIDAEDAEAALRERLEQAERQVRDAVQDFLNDVASNHAYNGAPDPGQQFYDWGLNTWLQSIHDAAALSGVSGPTHALADVAAEFGVDLTEGSDDA